MAKNDAPGRPRNDDRGDPRPVDTARKAKSKAKTGTGGIRPLTPKQQRFVEEYLVDLNGTQAAIRAGYSPKGAEVTASQTLRIAKVAAFVAAGKSRQLAKSELSAARVLEEMRRVAFVDARTFWDGEGALKPMADLNEEQGSQIAAFEAIIKNAEAGDGITDVVHKIKFWDKVRSLEMLAKHFALLTDVMRVEGVDSKVARLYAGRQRNAEAHAHRG